MPHLEQRFAAMRPFDEMERKLVRASLGGQRIDARDEAALRYALTLARMWVLPGDDGRDVAVGGYLAEYRASLGALLGPLLHHDGAIEVPKLWTATRRAVELAGAAREVLAERVGHRVGQDAIEREIRERQLVLVCGGGGGTAYGHLGVFALLEAASLRPALIAGSSMGSILGAFRARTVKFEVSMISDIVRELDWRKVFRVFHMESRYGLPGVLRLYLRSGIGRYFVHPDGTPLRLSDLAIPLLVTVTGIRRGGLPHGLEHYEHLAHGVETRGFHPNQVRLAMLRATQAMAEFVRDPTILYRLVLGASDGTRDFDAVDAIGFSSAVPGVIHYDVVRDDARMRALLDGLFARHDLSRLIDGGVSDNVPAASAWRAVQRGALRTRNAFLLALDGFAPRLSSGLWLPLQRYANENVKRNVPYAGLLKRFRHPLSPLDVVPSAQQVERVIERAKLEMLEDLPFVQRMMAPLPPLAHAQERLDLRAHVA